MPTEIKKGESGRDSPIVKSALLSNRAHEAVLKAKAQIERLSPLIADCDQHATLTQEVNTMRGCRDALRAFFAGVKAGLLGRRCESLELDQARVAERIATLDQREATQRNQRDDIKRAIAENGGDRIENLKNEIAGKESLKTERMGRAEKYAGLARAAGLSSVLDADAFMTNRNAIASETEAIQGQKAETQNGITDESVTLRQLRTQHGEIEKEIASLKKRRSNIPASMLAIREGLCRELRVDEEHFPFAGELTQLAQSGVELGSCFVAAGESNQGLGCLLGADFGM